MPSYLELGEDVNLGGGYDGDDSMGMPASYDLYDEEMEEGFMEPVTRGVGASSYYGYPPRRVPAGAMAYAYHQNEMKKKKEKEREKQLAVARTVSLVLGITVLALALAWLGYEIWYWNEYQSRMAMRMDFGEYLRRRFTGKLDDAGLGGSRGGKGNKNNRSTNNGSKNNGVKKNGTKGKKINGNDGNADEANGGPGYVEVTHRVFEQLINRPDKTTIALFHSHSCPGCRSYRPVFDTVASAIGREPAIASKVDLVTLSDKEFLKNAMDGSGETLAAKFDVNGIPAVVAFRDGQVQDKLTRLNLEPNQLVEFVQKNM